jgi:hypothetical protein
MKQIAFISALLLVLAAAGCKRDEAYLERRLADLDALAAKADDATRAKIEAIKAALAKKRAALPKGPARADAVHTLGKEARKQVRAAKKLLKASAAKAEAAAPQKNAAMRKRLAGYWMGDGMRLDIFWTGYVRYMRTKGSRRSNFAGKLKEVSATGFDVKVMGLASTSFRLDAPPTEGKDGAWTMTVDGIKLYRVRPPGKVTFGIRLCTRQIERFCIDTRTTFSAETKKVLLVYETKARPPAGTAYSIVWFSLSPKTGGPGDAGEGVVETELTTVEGVVEHSSARSQIYTIRGFAEREEPWAAGSYRVEVRIGGQKVAQQRFSVGST